MNIKTIAAIVGSLSLSALGAGCKTTASAEKPAAAVDEKGVSSSCGAGSCSGADKSGASTTSESGASATGQKGGSHSCGSGSCSGNR